MKPKKPTDEPKSKPSSNKPTHIDPIIEYIFDESKKEERKKAWDKKPIKKS